VPVYVDQSWLHPIHVGALPPQCAALTSLNSMVEEMAVEAALTGDPRLVYHAIAHDPLTAAMLSLAEIRSLAAEMPQEINYQTVSRAFGTPKATLANSYLSELLEFRTFPTLMGYSSRIMAESWESNALYWAELADEIHVPPAELNVRIPEWTRSLVERIFASHLEDWPALLRSLRLVGDDVRARSRGQGDQKASLQ
jgi:hypothetical protein